MSDFWERAQAMFKEDIAGTEMEKYVTWESLFKDALGARIRRAYYEAAERESQEKKKEGN